MGWCRKAGFQPQTKPTGEPGRWPHDGTSKTPKRQQNICRGRRKIDRL